MNDSGLIEHRLPERCGIAVALDLVAAGRALKPDTRIQVDAGAVARMSCAMVVALISLATAASETDAAIVIRAPTDAFIAAFADLDLFEALMQVEFAA